MNRFGQYGSTVKREVIDHGFTWQDRAKNNPVCVTAVHHTARQRGTAQWKHEQNPMQPQRNTLKGKKQ